MSKMRSLERPAGGCGNNDEQREEHTPRGEHFRAREFTEHVLRHEIDQNGGKEEYNRRLIEEIEGEEQPDDDQLPHKDERHPAEHTAERLGGFGKILYKTRDHRADGHCSDQAVQERAQAERSADGQEKTSEQQIRQEKHKDFIRGTPVDDEKVFYKENEIEDGDEDDRVQNPLAPQ